MSKEIVAQAMRERKLVRFTYNKEGEISTRTVEPYSFRDGALMAWDVDKQGLRQFKLEKIVSAAVSDADFSPRNDWEVEAPEEPFDSIYIVLDMKLKEAGILQDHGDIAFKRKWIRETAKEIIKVIDEFIPKNK